jgi:hypothetical protein
MRQAQGLGYGSLEAMQRGRPSSTTFGSPDDEIPQKVHGTIAAWEALLNAGHTLCFPWDGGAPGATVLARPCLYREDHSRTERF